MRQEDIKAEAEKKGPTVPLPKPEVCEGEAKESKLITSSYSSAEAQAAMNAPKKKIPTDFQLAFLLKNLKSYKVFTYGDRLYMITDSAVFDISDLPPIKPVDASEMLDALALYMPEQEYGTGTPEIITEEEAAEDMAEAVPEEEEKGTDEVHDIPVEDIEQADPESDGVFDAERIWNAPPKPIEEEAGEDGGS